MGPIGSPGINDEADPFRGLLFHTKKSNPLLDARSESDQTLQRKLYDQPLQLLPRRSQQRVPVWSDRAWA